VLARPWLRIIWRCWTDHIPYQPNCHPALTALLQAQNQQHSDTPEATPQAC
jgi:hypothetical protein